MTREEAETAVKAAYAENEVFKHDVQMEGPKALAYMKEHDCKGIVLAGRPYHVDPEINHGIPETICALGMVVLSEDPSANRSRGEAQPERIPRRRRRASAQEERERLLRHVDDRKVTKMPLRVTNQWAYHARLKAAANFCRTDRDSSLQLNSFGCGSTPSPPTRVSEILADKADVHHAQNRRGLQPGRGENPSALAQGGRRRA